LRARKEERRGDKGEVYGNEKESERGRNEYENSV